MYYMLLQNMPFICEQDFCRTVLNILTFCSLFIWDDVTNGVGRTVMVQCYEIVNFQLFFTCPFLEIMLFGVIRT